VALKLVCFPGQASKRHECMYVCRLDVEDGYGLETVCFPGEDRRDVHVALEIVCFPGQERKRHVYVHSTIVFLVKKGRDMYVHSKPFGCLVNMEETCRCS
jgi:hypothetical protein